MVTQRAQDPARWAHPLIERAAGDMPALVAQVGRLIDERERFFDALSPLPRSLAHQDYWRRNLFARAVPTEGRDDETVAADWAFVGSGPLGAEVGTLLAASIAFGELDPDAARRIEREAFEAYVSGLHDAGWSGNVRLVRLGYAAATAVQWGTCPTWLGVVNDEKRYAWVEQFVGRPLPEMVEYWVGLTRYVLGVAEEARQLMRAI